MRSVSCWTFENACAQKNALVNRKPRTPATCGKWAYPKSLLREMDLERCNWVCATSEFATVKVIATRFVNLQEKLFISSCSTSLDGPPRETKYACDVPRPQVAYAYLQNSAAIDIHNQLG